MGTIELTPGQRFLRLLKFEYMDLVKIAEMENRHFDYLIAHYFHEPWQLDNIAAKKKANIEDIAYYTKAMEQLGGAENEDTTILTESSDSESPSDEFVGITCTTVL